MGSSRRSRNIVLALVVTLVSTVAALSVAAPAQAGGPLFRLRQVRVQHHLHKIRFNPCQHITYKVNVRHVHHKRQAVREVRHAIHRVHRVTHMNFRFKGRTRAVPRRRNYHSMPAEIVVAFVRKRETNISLKGPTAGQGGSQYKAWQSPNGRAHVASLKGTVVLDQPQIKHWRSGLGGRGGVNKVNLISHELGHVVGLDHVNHRSQLMNPYLFSGSPAGFAPGDRRGLRRVGRRAGCIHIPAYVKNGS